MSFVRKKCGERPVSFMFGPVMSLSFIFEPGMSYFPKLVIRESCQRELSKIVHKDSSQKASFK